MRNPEGLTRDEHYRPIQCVNCDATADLKARGASCPAEIGWLHRHDGNEVKNYCPDCRGVVEVDGER